MHKATIGLPTHCSRCGEQLQDDWVIHLGLDNSSYSISYGGRSCPQQSAHDIENAGSIERAKQEERQYRLRVQEQNGAIERNRVFFLGATISQILYSGETLSPNPSEIRIETAEQGIWAIRPTADGRGLRLVSILCEEELEW